MFSQRPGCFFICGTAETRRTGLAALPFDGGSGYHSDEVASDERLAEVMPT
eukprot:SAG31_NODE_42875_length_269_cov_1.217647_1_plen_50_part_10